MLRRTTPAAPRGGMVPGKPLYFATAMPLDGVALGVLAESYMGRPIKIEGNPQHPASLGATDALDVMGRYLVPVPTRTSPGSAKPVGPSN